MKVAIADEEDAEGMSFEKATILTKSAYGYSWTRTKHEAFLVDFADLASYLQWSLQFWAVQTEEAWLEADDTSIVLATTRTEPDVRDD